MRGTVWVAELDLRHPGGREDVQAERYSRPVSEARIYDPSAQLVPAIQQRGVTGPDLHNTEPTRNEPHRS